MAIVRVFFFFGNRDSFVDTIIAMITTNPGSNRTLELEIEEDGTYEEAVKELDRYKFLPPLDDPRLRYNLVLQIISLPTSTHGMRSVSESITWKEGQTLASSQLIPLLPDSEKNNPSGWEQPIRDSRNLLYCAVSVGMRDGSQPKEKSRSASPSFGETILTDLTSQGATAAANFVTIATALIAFTGALNHVAKQWSKKRKTNSTSLPEYTSPSSETDIVTIRLRMTHGPDHEFEEWLTDPEQLKHYIDVFNKPSSSIQPLQAVFVQRNGKAIKVDVSEGTQDNLQLNELLSYLHIDEIDKDPTRRGAISWSTHFIFYRTVSHESVPTNHGYWGTIYDLNITYEELVEFLVEKKHLLLPLDPPLRYALTFKGIVDDGPYFGPYVLKEGQTVLDALQNVYSVESSKYALSHYECDISIETEASPSDAS